MEGRIVLITGANKGIGFEVARQMGSKGHRIWLGSRDEDRGGAAACRLASEGLDVRALILDVTSEESVLAAETRIRAEDGRLDVLINNAGIPGGQGKPPSQQPLDDIEAVYATNVYAPIRVTQTFLPLLKAGNGAAVVMVINGLGSLAWLSDPDHPYNRVNILGYNSSKTALNAVTVSFAKEFKAYGIVVNAADPGYTATDFNDHTGYRTVEQAAAGIVWLADCRDPEATGGFYFEQTRAPW
ncbi:SDR family oxidoreductase [Sphingomonas morindae]|uniref:SDR family oxidoreductase n=1 Tax=Sphingomonas morindae TaxID=1541170 RepID=A0ABY4XAH5_9SPHN|nr:SDR family oxidoreductase [Sphingomonas morindae]USI73928.1 SDR family oxidoreductase [Sphingomonas morindae]